MYLLFVKMVFLVHDANQSLSTLNRYLIIRVTVSQMIYDNAPYRVGPGCTHTHGPRLRAVCFVARLVQKRQVTQRQLVVADSSF